MKPLLTKWIATALAFAAMSAAHGARDPMTLDSTATSLFFRDNPKAELKAPRTLDQIARIKEELITVLDARVVTAKHEEFFLPEPFLYGVINLGLTDAMLAALEPKFDANGVLDVSASIGFPELDAANRKWNVTKYVKGYKGAKHVKVHFDTGINPHHVADTFRGATDVRWAEASSLSGIGGGTDVRRISNQRNGRNYSPSVYVLTLGWGDCPAGCMAQHRSYFEIQHKEPSGLKAFLVGEAGTPLPADMRAEYYK